MSIYLNVDECWSDMFLLVESEVKLTHRVNLRIAHNSNYKKTLSMVTKINPFTLSVLTLALLTQRVPFCFPVSPIDTAF